MRWSKYLVIGVVGVAVIAALVFAFRFIQQKFHLGAEKTPLNIILVISDQQAFRLRDADGYQLPAHVELQRHGVTFTNHYTAAAMCSPSRASFLTGTTPQVHGVFDQMEYPFTPTLNPKRANMGSALKDLGYQTAYFGKFEMDKKVLMGKSTENTSQSIKPYGFDIFNPDGDTGGAPRQGYTDDPYFIGEAVRWLHQHASNTDKAKKPFFMVVSLLNPHDIMYGDANLPGLPQVQKPALPLIMPPPATTLYAKKWHFTLPETLHESLSARGMPNALLEYQNGWAGMLGFIPTDRHDMWNYYYNYYLNAIRDDDRKLQTLTDTLNEMNLWKNTIVIFTADHGEMGGAHGGLRGKGPMAYEENAHVPLIIAHPDAPHGVTCHTLTSHLDLLPTMIGLTGLRSALSETLPGHDFSSLLHNPEHAAINAIRPAVLFNYVGLSTIDGNYLLKLLVANLGHKPQFPPLTEVNLGKQGQADGRLQLAQENAAEAATQLEQASAPAVSARM